MNLVSTNGIFTRLGRYAGRINSLLNGQGGATLTAPSVSAGVAYTNILAQHTSGSAQADMMDGYVANVLAPSRAKLAEVASLQALAQAELVRTVNDDTPLKAYTLQYAMAELIRQMGVGLLDSKVSPSVVAATNPPTQASGSVGTAFGTTSKTGPLMWPNINFTTGSNAMDLQYIVPETITLKCTADSYTGGATKFSELFSLLGPPTLVTDKLLWNYTTTYGATNPSGSGASQSLYVCDAAKYQGAGLGGNLLNNGDFFNFTAHSPNNWVAVLGTPNTDFTDVGATGKSVIGGQCLALQFAGNPITLTQQFGSAGGTTSTLLPNTVYAINLYGLKDTGSTGTTTIDLIDGNNAVIADNNAVNNTFNFTSASLGTTYANPPTGTTWAYFRTPASLPAVQKLRIRTTANVAVANSYLSHLSMRVATQAYTGGPYISLFSAATANLVGDVYNCAFTNDLAGGAGYSAAGNKLGYGQMFNLLFSMRDVLQMQLPTTGTTLIADSGVS